MAMVEFARSVVQAGRRCVDLSAPHVPRYEFPEDVLGTLQAVDHRTWDEMAEALPQSASDETEQTGIADFT